MADTWYEIVFPPLVTLAVVALAAVLLWLARGKLAEFVRELGIQKVSALGVDLQFVQHQTQVAYADKKELPPPSQEDLTTVRDAARFLVPLVAQSRLLWVDDNPGGNSAERAILLAWEVDVQAARTTVKQSTSSAILSRLSIWFSLTGGDPKTATARLQGSTCSSGCPNQIPALSRG